jgi:hypothetical protein
MRQVVSGVWQMDQPADGGQARTVLFAVNLSDKTAEADLRLFPQEYGVDCPEVLHLTMRPRSVEVREYGV